MSEKGLKRIEIPASITVRDLAELIEVSPIDVIKKLMASGVMANINQEIDFDTAAILVVEFGYEAELRAPEVEEPSERVDIPNWRKLIRGEDPASLVPRPPVATILGHVDHGKTTLLDAIREANVAGGEVGGITQHISAYQVQHNGRLITFLDTPGHEAFTAMRARGAQGADIAVLVVAADDGVMPQTREAVSHARAAGVPMVVALNKMDREAANPERVMQQLADIGLQPDEWDGDTMVVPVSAKTGEGIGDLLEAILLVADSDEIEIKANPEGKVIGTVIDAEVDKARGIVATLLVQNGTLRVGDVVVVGTSHGRVRAMFDHQGNPIEEAKPSAPVGVLGLSTVPNAGELFTVVESTKEARAIVEEREEAVETEAAHRQALTLDQIFDAFKSGEARELRLVIKADGQGSLEPIISSVENLGTEDIRVNVLYAGTGNISESDVMLAAASGAIIIGFNVTTDQAAERAAEAEKVDIRIYDIIYRLTEDIEKALKGLLEPEIQEVSLGKARVLAVFNIPRVGPIAGCRVLEGVLRRNARVRVYRDGELVFDGEVSSLKHEKDDVREIREGFECGIGLKGFADFEQGDQLFCYATEAVPAA
jgi:translation initiation factor IF-2